MNPDHHGPISSAVFHHSQFFYHAGETKYEGGGTKHSDHDAQPAWEQFPHPPIMATRPRASTFLCNPPILHADMEWAPGAGQVA